MAAGDITILKEQLDGSLKEIKLVPSEIGAQYSPILSENAPAIENLEDNQEWIRTSDFQKFLLYNDGDSRSWIQLPPSSHSHPYSHTVFSENPPLTPNEGDRWIDSINLRAYERLNNSWIELVTV
jgi:hypothetical protein